MLLWIAFAFLTAAVLAGVLAPLVRAPREHDDPDSGEHGTLAVYRDQLREIETDRARGALSADEAEAARLEVSRRLLASSARTDQVGSPAASRDVVQSRRATAALATAIIVPLVTIGLYLAYGSPGLPASPFATRTDAGKEQAAIADLVSRVEARLRENPEEGKGWEVIAPVYLRLGRFRDAANAYANAARINGETVLLLAGRAEAAVLAADGIVTEEARSAYEKMLKLEPGRPEPRFWLAMAKEQDGRLADALQDYRKLLADAPADATYRSALEARIQHVEARVSGVGTPSARGPSEADAAAAAELSPEQRSQMIAGMVDGLAQRLKTNGRDLPGWLRLLNAYTVLNRKDDARAALAEARRNFAGDAPALGALSQAATKLGLDS